MAQVKPIPEGQHTITPHLTVQGAAAAIDFYKKAFGAVELARMPMPDGKIMHAHLKIGDSHLFLCDEFPNTGWQASRRTRLGGASVTIHLNVEDVDAVSTRPSPPGPRRRCR